MHYIYLLKVESALI